MNDQQKDLMAELGARDAKRCAAAMDDQKRDADGKFGSGGGSSESSSIDTIHLDAIEYRLSNERARLSAAKTPREKAFRQQQVAQAEKELKSEYDFLEKKHGYKPSEEDKNMSDEDLLKALQG